MTTPTPPGPHPTRGPQPPAARTAAPPSPLLIAVDGGNSKTEVVVLEPTPEGPAERFRTITAGSGGGPAAVVASVEAALAEAGVGPAEVARVSAAVAGLDLPGDEEAHLQRLQLLFPGARIDVVNDAVAVLETCGGLGPALAIVCGAGLNAVARGDAGLATVPALGWASGDWGGGDELGREAVRAAARAEDGRGPASTLHERVLRATGMPDAAALARAVRDRVIGPAEVGALARVVAGAAAEGDAVASRLIDRAAAEAVALADVVTRRAWGPIGPEPGTPAVLAGGLFSDPGFAGRVEGALAERGFVPERLALRPVDGLVRALRDETAEARDVVPPSGFSPRSDP